MHPVFASCSVRRSLPQHAGLLRMWRQTLPRRIYVTLTPTPTLALSPTRTPTPTPTLTLTRICSRLGATHLIHVANRQGYPSLPPLPPLPPPPSPPPPLPPPALPPSPPPPTIDRVIGPWLGLGIGAVLGLGLVLAAIHAWRKTGSEAERLNLHRQAVVIAATTTTHLDYKL